MEKVGWKFVLLLAFVTNVIAIPLEDFYPFDSEAGDAVVARNDDGSSPSIAVPSGFPFFGLMYSNLFVNNNGHITPGSSSSHFSPTAFPDNDPRIAVLWGDVDTRPADGGFIWYRVSSEQDLLEQVIDDIQRGYPSVSSLDYVLVATWDHVGFYNGQTHLTNTFQCVLARSGDRSYAIFLYADDLIQWPTSGNALAGYNAGDLVTSYTIPGSLSTEILNITSTSNVDVPGMWAFQLNEYVTPCADISSANYITPRFGNMLGGTAIRVCVSLPDDITPLECVFEGVTTTGVRVSDNEILCVSPQFSLPGSVRLNISGISESVFMALPFDRSHKVNVTTRHHGLLIDFFQENQIEWNPDDFLPSLDSSITRVDVDMVLLTREGEWVDFVTIASDIENTGAHTTRRLRGFYELCPRGEICPVVIRIKPASFVGTSVLTPIVNYISIWSGVYYYTHSVAQSFEENHFSSLCMDWTNRQEEQLEEIDSLLPCPLQRSQAGTINSGYVEQDFSSMIGQTSFSDQWFKFFHPTSESCYVQSSVRSGSRQQCCYSSSGMILLESRGAGNPDLHAPIDAEGIQNHIFEDLLPYIYCCAPEESNCLQFTNFRPPSDGMGYSPPIPACVYGDPHIVTLDGLKYTFNGKGEYTLIQTEGNVFTLQGRMIEATDLTGMGANATVFSAIAAKQTNSDTVQFELSESGIDARVNGEVVDFSDSVEQPFTEVTVTDRGNETLSALFSSGVIVEVMRDNDIISTVLVSVPDDFQVMTTGLMGNFNGDTSDDLAPRSGDGVGEPISPDSSLQEIHEEFGITWIIHPEEENLFVYLEDESFSTYYDPDYTPTFEPSFDDEELEELAQEICGEDQFCLFDIATTQDLEIGISTLIGGVMFENIVNISAPITCEPPCENNGACVATNTCVCSEVFTGPYCSEMIISECETNLCQNGGICSLIGNNYVCECPRGYSGVFCEIEPLFVDCDCSRDIECSITGHYVENNLLKVIPAGDVLSCLIAFDRDLLSLERVQVDGMLASDHTFLSPGSLAFLDNLGVVETRNDYSMCTIDENFLSSLPSGSPTGTLTEMGAQTLFIQFMEDDGSFQSRELSTDDISQVVNNRDYNLGGALSDSNACSFQHLIYWLANEPESDGGSGDGVSGSGISEEDLLGPDSSGSGMTSPDEVLSVSVSDVICQQTDTGHSDIVFPVTCT